MCKQGGCLSKALVPPYGSRNGKAKINLKDRKQQLFDEDRKKSGHGVKHGPIYGGAGGLPCQQGNAAVDRHKSHKISLAGFGRQRHLIHKIHHGGQTQGSEPQHTDHINTFSPIGASGQQSYAAGQQQKERRLPSQRPRLPQSIRNPARQLVQHPAQGQFQGSLDRSPASIQDFLDIPGQFFRSDRNGKQENQGKNDKKDCTRLCSNGSASIIANTLPNSSTQNPAEASPHSRQRSAAS